MTKLLQCLRDELVRRDYAASTIRSYIQIVEAFRQHTGARLDRLTPAEAPTLLPVSARGATSCDRDAIAGRTWSLMTEM